MSNDPGEINPDARWGKPEDGFLGLMRSVALVVLMAGAMGSIGLMLYVGRRNNSTLLLVLFAIWVLSPFVGFLLVDLISKRWSRFTRATLYGMMLVLTLGSLATYGSVALRPPKSSAAAAFVIVPPGSWLLLMIALSIAALISRKLSRRGSDQHISGNEPA
jgi:hypothetical protein